jgi:hypothetical protein
MQPAAVSGLTAAQITALIQDAAAVEIDAGLELLDINLSVLADLTTDLNRNGSSVGRANYATLHGTATLQLSTELNWGTAIVRPYMTMTDGTVTGRFNLGAYLTSAPQTVIGDNPSTHEVAGFDLLHWLNTPVGESYVVEAGVGYLAAVATILTTQGITQYQIDQTRADQVLASAKVWAFSDDVTWLNVINDLLAGVGYQGIWSDWDGRLQVRPYQTPTDRAAEWLYTSDLVTSMLGVKRTVTRDMFDAPNRWVHFWSQAPEGSQPVEGAGIYTYQNDTNGPTSVAARGRVISAKPVSVDVVDQAALVAFAQQRIDSDIRLKTTWDVTTFPNPLHWQWDRLAVADAAAGPIVNVLAVSWSLPLDGGDMTQTWSVL